MHPSSAIPEGPERRAALTAGIMARTGLTESALERFLRAFYGAARVDPVLAPAFAGVADWERHIATLTEFWSSVALMTGRYHGQPMRAHIPLKLAPPHFVAWLALFERTARAHFSPSGAEHMLDRARRIARSMEMGLTPLPLPTLKPRPGQGANP